MDITAYETDTISIIKNDLALKIDIDRLFYGLALSKR